LQYLLRCKLRVSVYVNLKMQIKDFIDE